MTGFHWQVKQEECALFASVPQCCHPETGQFQCHCVQKEIKSGLTDIQSLTIPEGFRGVSTARFSYFQLLIQQLLFRSQSSPDNRTCFVNSPLKRVTRFACSQCQKILTKKLWGVARLLILKLFWPRCLFKRWYTLYRSCTTPSPKLQVILLSPQCCFQAWTS